jgi:tRNA G18 (ribose-2'-O)-methylase SpoU
MKVLRGACGAHFYIPLVPDLVSDSIKTQIREQLSKNKEVPTQIEERINNARSESEAVPNSQMKVGIVLADSNLSDKRFNVPFHNYSEIDYCRFNHVFVTIGGETEGLGNELVNLVKEMSQNSLVEIYRVSIPLAYGMDSLNASNAFGIIAFEIQRQFRSMSKRR